MLIAVPDGARCLGCGYQLRGLPTPVCPECGADFNPKDPLSYFDPDYPERAPLRLRPIKPVARVEIALVGMLAAGLAVLRATIVGLLWIDEGGFRLIATILAALAIRWMWIRSAYRARCRSQQPHLVEDFELHRARWWGYSALVALAITITLVPAPLHLRFQLSRPFLEREVARWEADLLYKPRDKWVGLEHVHRLTGGRGVWYLRFELSRHGAYSYGYAYHAAGAPAGWGSYTVLEWLTPKWAAGRW